MDLEIVEHIVSLLSEHPVSEITLEREGLRVMARRPLMPIPQAAPVADANGAELEADEEAASASDAVLAPAPPEPLLLTSGMVGLYRHAEPPVGYGAHVAPGQIVGSIEAMKVLNDVRAEAGGQVVDVSVEEGAPVEYGQALFRLMPQ